MQILEEHGRRYRIACTSPNTEAVIATVVSGLAVAVLALSTVPAGARILTDAEGFPGFPRSTVMLPRHPAATPYRNILFSRHIFSLPLYLVFLLFFHLLSLFFFFFFFFFF